MKIVDGKRETRKMSHACVKLWMAYPFLFAGLLTGGCDRHDVARADPHAGHAHAAAAIAALPAGHSHADPGKTCFICDPAQRDEGRLWCREHGRYEDRCWLCHPELEDKAREYCAEHFLYEDECFLCHPEPKSSDAADAQHADHDHDHGHVSAAGLAGLYCNEHRLPESSCAICQPQLAAGLEPGASIMVRFPSAAAADKAGVRVGRAGSATIASGIHALCEVQYNQDTLARVTPLAAGVIQKVHREQGERVAAGDVLIEIHSSAVADAKSAYLTALVERDNQRQNHEREKRLAERNLGAQKNLLAAEAANRMAQLAVANARQQLLNFGMANGEISEIERTHDASALLSIRAPFGGTLIERTAVVGEAVEPGQALFTVSDLKTRWLELSLPSHHLGQVNVGQFIEAKFDEIPGVAITGRITWLDTSIDPRSRMIRARALVEAGAEKLASGLFGEARILIGEAKPAVVVPREAVQRHEQASFVIVPAEADLFALRRVELGTANGETVEVMSGLAADEPVVMAGAFVVMSEFLKSRLGAGCADH